MTDVLRALKHPESQTVEKVSGRQQAGNWAELEASLFWKEQKDASELNFSSLSRHSQRGRSQKLSLQAFENQVSLPLMSMAEILCAVACMLSSWGGTLWHGEGASPFRKAETSLSWGMPSSPYPHSCSSCCRLSRNCLQARLG